MITRFAPCPSYYAHLGHLRGLLLISEEVRKTPGSKLYLRFDDTTPEPCLPEYYRSFLRLFREYGIPLAGVSYASKRLAAYQAEARRLIRQGKAYACTCDNTEDRAYRADCHCKLLAMPWIPSDSRAVIRMVSARQADYAIMRFVPDKGYRPTLVFQSAVDDRDMGVTLLYRGVDLQSSEARLREVFSIISKGRGFPACRYWGRVSLYHSGKGEEYPLSKRLRGSQWEMPGLRYLEGKYGRKALARFLLSHGATKNSIRMDLKRLERLSLSYK